MNIGYAAWSRWRILQQRMDLARLYTFIRFAEDQKSRFLSLKTCQMWCDIAPQKGNNFHIGAHVPHPRHWREACMALASYVPLTLKLAIHLSHDKSTIYYACYISVCMHSVCMTAWHMRLPTHEDNPTYRMFPFLVKSEQLLTLQQAVAGSPLLRLGIHLGKM